MDRTRIGGMAGRTPLCASIGKDLETAFDVIDLLLWIMDLFGAMLDLLRDYGNYLLGD